MSSQCIVHVFKSRKFVVSQRTVNMRKFPAEDLDADERKDVLEAEITQRIQHPNDIRDGTVCDSSLAILKNILTGTVFVPKQCVSH